MTLLNPLMGEIWLCAGRPVLVMGNTSVPGQDGATFIWCADFASGMHVMAPEDQLQKAQDQIPFRKSVKLVSRWAGQGNADAMWWLGSLYETGSPTIPANGGKALAYYLAAIRCQPQQYSKEVVDRILRDGIDLFAESRASAKQDETPKNRQIFLKNFREYRDLNSHGRLHYPDVWDWKACVKVAESLS